MEAYNTKQVFDALENGRGTAKEAAVRMIESNNTSIDRSYLRQLIVDALVTKYIPPQDEKQENVKHQDTRCWLLSALGRLCSGDQKSTDIIKEHLDPTKEPYEWARYWALEGLVSSKDITLEKEARNVISREKSIVVLGLANAILAGKGDKTARQFICDSLRSSNDNKRWAVLRALRVIPLLDNSIINTMCQIVDKGRYANSTFDAIAALGKLPSDYQQAENASQYLMNYLITYRWPMHESMRIKAINGLGNLGFERTASVLVEELADDSPAIVSHAARALEKILGVQVATKRIFDVAAKSGPEFAARYANALRSMNRDAVVEELEKIMLTGTESEQETARALLSEVGGAQAFQRLSARTRAVNQYMNVLEATEARVRDLFEKTLMEAKHGYRVATIMDTVVFFIGVSLIGVSGALALSTKGDLNNFAGIGVTGGLGVLGVLYGILISNPRKQIPASVDHLMYLKVVFLAYLRQLHQTDQAFTRRLLEDNVMTAAEVEEFSTMVANVLADSVAHLTRQDRPRHVTTTVTMAENGQKKATEMQEHAN